MSKKYKIYTLDDGSKVTVKGIIKKTGLKECTVRYRLAKTKDPKKLYEKLQVHKPIKPYHNKLYRLMLRAI